jgi:phage N-6-adenine-methyltransferase
MPRRRKYRDNAARQRAYRRRKRLPVNLRHKSIEWETPPDLFEKLDHEFGFTLDVCATPENAKCETFFTKEQDALQQNWTGVVWCNPPYGLALRQWIQKAYASSRCGATVVCLLPNRSDTRWWHEYILPYAEIRFVRGRLKFNGVGSSAPFPSVLAVFRKCQCAK